MPRPQYLKNFSEITDSVDPSNKSHGKYTHEQIADATNKLNAREYAAFGHFAGDASSQGIKKLAEAYLGYLNQLSPEEQNSLSYAGTKESATALLAGVNAQIAGGKSNPGKKPDQPTSLLIELLNAMTEQFKKNGININSSVSSPTSESQVTISEEARKLASQS
ncbi:hypothetical protein CKO20_05565 [Rhodocyclus tenuis]|nr:hypothetical protein [Rhodocyclus tenuis]